MSSSRSLNKVQLIGNLTRDPELRYTPQGTAVCTFGLATNRSWTTDSGEKREDVEFHRVVTWAKLAEVCSKILFKGRKVYIEGRLSTRQWDAQDGTKRSATEVVVSDMIILDNKRAPGEEGAEDVAPSEPAQGAPQGESAQVADVPAAKPAKKTSKKSDGDVTAEEISEDIPF